jgi:uncharacterized membrane protein
MPWIGGLIGLFLGCVLGSLAGGMVLTALGVALGVAYKSRRLPSAPGTPANPAPPSLVQEVAALKLQIEALSRRLAVLEAGAGAVSSAATDQEAAPSRPTEPVAPAAAPQTMFAPELSDVLPVPAAALAVQPPAIPARQPEPPAQRAEPAAPAIPESRLPPPFPPAPPSFFETTIKRWIFGGNPIVKIGVLILFLGLAFLLSYAAENSLLPIELRYAAVAAGGLALLVGGWRWRNRNDSYGLVLQGAGIGVLYLVTLAAMKAHQLIPTGFGFAIMVCVAAFAALLAVLQNSLVLAIVGTLAGFATPVLVSTGSGNHIALFSYMTVLNLGIVAIAWFKAWRALNLIGFACSFALGSGWAAKYYRDDLYSTTQPFLLLLFALYVLITLLFARRTLADHDGTTAASYGEQIREAASRISYVDGTLAFGVPFLTFGLQYLLVSPWEQGAAFSALGLGLFYMSLAFASHRRGGRRYLLLNETLLALGVVFGSLAIPLALEAGWTSAAWAVEAAGAYWIGIRQQRWHARIFALVLMAGSIIAFLLGVEPGEASVLSGSALGSALLASSLWWTYSLMHRYAEQTSVAEKAVLPSIIALGAFFVALIPLILWDMNWAAPALAVLGTCAVFAGLRLPLRALTFWGLGYQALAGVFFMTTMQSNASGPVLANGWSGLLAASLIGGSMLAGAWAIVREQLINAGEADSAAPAPIGSVASVAMLAGLVFINLAPLFVMPMRYAAMVWPLTGLGTLWWALRMRHAGALKFALGLQAVAGFAYFQGKLFGSSSAPAQDTVAAFLHTGFWGPVLLALAALTCARLLHRPVHDQEAAPTERTFGTIALVWAALWWSAAWTEEIDRLLAPEAVAAALVAVTIATAWTAQSFARRWNWRQLGLGTLGTLPVLAVIALSLIRADVAHPLATAWGALAWPAALVLHGWLLKRQSEWVSDVTLKVMHVCGAWLFVLLAATELRWQFAFWSEPGSAWSLLGWMVVPVAYLWALSSAAVCKRWPVREYHDAYRIVSAIPVALYLLAWVWISNMVSAGNAAPLPYVPLLNPLEIAQLAVVLGIGVWWTSVRAQGRFAVSVPQLTAVAGSTLMAMLTGMVLRTCHHWGGVAWELPALLDSNLVQTSLSLAWGSVAIGLMLIGNRRQRRWVWITGAVLIGFVVIKLFLVELSASGTLARIVSFIVVGLLLLLVGFFAPLPPRVPAKPIDGQAEPA